MPVRPSFPLPASAPAEETTGRYAVTFRDSAVAEGLAALRDRAGIAGLASTADFPEFALDLSQLEAAGGAVFPTLGVAVASLDPEALTRVMTLTAEASPILAVEPERRFYAIGDGLPADYLRGYRDAASHLYEQAVAAGPPTGMRPEACFADDAQSTWGLKATQVHTGRYAGRGVKVAVLDTGMDLQHPDFEGRSVASQSFVPGESVEDGQGHGTHCIGTAGGNEDLNGRRYGVAGQSTLYAGKVLGNSGSGYTSWILAGMEWAVDNQCQVISMSLGNTVPTPSTAYETAGRRALQNGCLIVAAAGNHGPRPVGQPANSPSIMAVAALDPCLEVAGFSSPSGTAPGANVDIAAPGVGVYSSVPLNRGRYATFNGTSMATPHVAGVAALYAEAFGVGGWQLWQLLTSRALRVPVPTSHAGSGLVQAPQP